MTGVCTLQTDKDKLNDSYAALERKAALYDKLSQGCFDDDEEQYNVDFLQKGFSTDEMRPHDRHRPAYDPAEPIDTSAMAVRASGVVLNLLLCLLSLAAEDHVPHGPSYSGIACNICHCLRVLEGQASQ